MLFFFLKFVKVLAVAALFAGSIGAVMARDYEERRRFALRLAGPAFGATWITGFCLASEMGHSLLSTWIIGALVLSFVSLQGVLYATGKEGRRGPVAAALVLVPLVATVALMVWKPI